MNRYTNEIFRERKHQNMLCFRFLKSNL